MIRRIVFVAVLCLAASAYGQDGPAPTVEPPASQEAAGAAEAGQQAEKEPQPEVISYTQMLEESPSSGGEKAPKIPTGDIPIDEVKKLKREVLEYKEAMDSPPAKHPGKHRVLPYQPDPQKVLTAVGYGTVIKVPWAIRPEKGVVVGDQQSFKIEPLDPTRVAIYPVRPFWSSNLIIFFKDESHSPALLFIEEAYGTGQADYYVEMVADEDNNVMTADKLLHLAMTGSSLGSPTLDALRRPEFVRGKGVARLEAKLRSPEYRVYVLDGQWECLSGCDLWVEAPDSNATVIGAYPGTRKISVCEKKASKFAERKHYEIVME